MQWVQTSQAEYDEKAWVEISEEVGLPVRIIRRRSGEVWQVLRMSRRLVCFTAVRTLGKDR